MATGSTRVDPEISTNFCGRRLHGQRTKAPSCQQSQVPNSARCNLSVKPLIWKGRRKLAPVLCIIKGLVLWARIFGAEILLSHFSAAKETWFSWSGLEMYRIRIYIYHLPSDGSRASSKPGGSTPDISGMGMSLGGERLHLITWFKSCFKFWE